MKSVCLAGADVYVDVHSPGDLDSDGFWKNFHRKSGGKHTLDFGGDHKKQLEKRPSGISHNHEVADKAAEIQQRISRKSAHNAIEEERQRQIDEHAAVKDEDHQERQANRKSALQAMNQAQKEQIKERGKNSMIHSEDAANRIAALKKEMLNTDNLEKAEERERKANRRRVSETVSEEQREIVEELEAKDANAQKVIQTARRVSVEMQDAEKARRLVAENSHEEADRVMTAKRVSATIHNELLEEAGEMERKRARRSSNALMEQEAKRRMLEHGATGKEHLTMKQQLRKSLLQDELVRSSVTVH